MTKTLIINDLHLGVQRTGGTTLESAVALREWLHTRHDEIMQLAVTHSCNRIVVNGDLTDAFSLPLNEALAVYESVDRFMTRNPSIEVIHCTGNHDMSKDSSKMGTVTFIGALLSMKHPGFQVISTPRPIEGSDIYAVPHCSNQDTFRLALEGVPDTSRWVLVHANADNKFACDADHSLDVSREVMKSFKARGMKMVFGHEHQGREMMSGHIIIVGNPVPSSVSDCLAHGDAQKSGTKRAMIIDHDTGTHEFVTTWTEDDAEGWFARIDWKDLATVEEEGCGFVRVEGDASAAEAADVIKAVSAFRQRSKSFVVANAVKIEQMEGLDDLSASLEDIKSLSVLELLMEQLTEPQQVAVRKLLEEA